MSQLLEMVSATARFRVAGGELHALRGVNLSLKVGEALGLVGESGSGKTTAAMAMMGLQPLHSGQVLYRGEDIGRWSASRLRQMRHRAQLVWQDPRAAFNPRIRVGESIMEPLVVHKLGRRAQREQMLSQLLADVGLAEMHADRLPSQLSGGQLQRAAIARALATSPEVIVLDEPISALDVSVAAHVLNLLVRLRAERSLSYLFIAHDLPAVAHVCERVAVMYMGKVVEVGAAREVFGAPRHPYTQALVSAAPTLNSSADGEPVTLGAALSSPLNPPAGCALHPRCPFATAICRQQLPALREVAPRRQVACHHADGHGVPLR